MRRNRDLPLLLLRADADAAQGTGHVMRSLALARAWQSQGGSAHFITVRPAPSVRRRIEAAGARVIEVGEWHPAPGDLESTIATLEKLRREADADPWIVLDGYHFSPDYQGALRRAGCRLLIIDDNAHWQRYEADILLNHGIQAPRLDYHDSGDAWLLLGTRYALLRAEFESWRSHERNVEKEAKNILITLGGADADNVTAKVMGGLALLGDLGLDIQILAGPLNPHIAELHRVAAMAPNMRLLTDVADPAPLMAWADIAVAAGGTTAWELAFMQTPALLLVLAENQMAVADGIGAFGAGQSLGWANKLTSAAIGVALRRLIQDAPRRRRMADRGKILVDGMGPGRVVAAMEKRKKSLRASELTIRHASFDDELLLWQWANDPVTRRNSFSTGPISWEEHQRWCAKKYASPDCRLWIMRVGDFPVGQIRYERAGGDTAEVSFSVAPGFRGRQLGTRLLQSTVDLAARELAVRWIRGAALVENQASHRTFLKSGFVSAEHKTVSGQACVIFRRKCGVPSLREDHVGSY